MNRAVGTECVSGEGLGEWWNDSWEGSGGRGKLVLSIREGIHFEK